MAQSACHCSSFTLANIYFTKLPSPQADNRRPQIPAHLEGWGPPQHITLPRLHYDFLLYILTSSANSSTTSALEGERSRGNTSQVQKQDLLLKPSINCLVWTALPLQKQHLRKLRDQGRFVTAHSKSDHLAPGDYHQAGHSSCFSDVPVQ